MIGLYSAKKTVLGLSFFGVMSVFFMSSLFVSYFSVVKEANACCWACAQSDCDAAKDYIEMAHDRLLNRVETEFDNDLDEYEDWLIEVMFKTQFYPAMIMMTTQMSAIAVQYTQIIGSFLDAQIQMDTQRLFRKLQFQAHKDYRPSEEFCWYGTNVKSLAASDSKSKYNSLALSQVALTRQLGNINAAGAVSLGDDYLARWDQFVDTYCDPGDNNYQSTGTGLELACDHDGAGGSSDVGAQDRARANRDIDYPRLIDYPRTLDVDFADNTLNDDNGDEEDVIALSRNLYGHKILSRDLSQFAMKGENARKLYLALRSVAAKRGVAQASFNAIVGLKSSGTSNESSGNITYPSGATVPAQETQTSRFLAAIVSQLLPSSSSGDVIDLIGQSPSYYSQLEILAKRIYQNPEFYANLYDTPANVSRKKVAMRAVDLMVDRAIYESQLRREMSISVLLASRLRASHRLANKDLSNGGTN